LIRIDTSTSTIFGLQLLISYDEIHFKLILQKKQPLFANDSRYLIVSEIKVFESELFNEKTRECIEIIL
jgi:hypothetical protein